MEYDFRRRTGSSYESAAPLPGRRPNSDFRQAHSLYPDIGGTATPRNPNLHRHPPPPPNSGLGIRVTVKPEHRITPPPPLLPELGEIPRSNFRFDFDFERNVLVEAVKESPNWSRIGIEIVPPKAASRGPRTDPVASKFIAAGLNSEAVPLAVANYGDNPTKVKEFANGYSLLREMGFSSNNVAEALLMYDNDTDKALAHFLNTA
ncbi:uncharacterized protein LOC127256156 [Andrographis paniculata]|uniref:uncharacterized protein LOC127256156 n=1 Tax=Andrographis paniculata TaxID=175694 RepID=UPI0021E7D542|nr:uncharacterized protein LOC127256156 [Andrographis paniculata]